MDPENKIWRWFRLLPLFAVVWMFVAGALLIQFWPAIPQSKSQWALFFVFGPPLYVLGEGIFEWAFSKRHGHGIAPQRFSCRRILLGVAVAVCFITLFIWISWLFAKP